MTAGKYGTCPDCGSRIGVTARGKIVRHNRWHAKGLSIKSGRYWAHCEGSGQQAKAEAGSSKQEQG